MAVCVVVLVQSKRKSQNGENISLNIVLNIEKTVILGIYHAVLCVLRCLTISKLKLKKKIVCVNLDRENYLYIQF